MCIYVHVGAIQYTLYTCAYTLYICTCAYTLYIQLYVHVGAIQETGQQGEGGGAEEAETD